MSSPKGNFSAVDAEVKEFVEDVRYRGMEVAALRYMRKHAGFDEIQLAGAMDFLGIVPVELDVESTGRCVFCEDVVEREKRAKVFRRTLKDGCVQDSGKKRPRTVTNGQ